MVGAGRDRRRPADGGPRRHHREHRPAIGSARPRLQQWRPAVDRHRLLPGLRKPAPARRASGRPRRAQEGLPGRGGRLRGRLRPRGRRPQLRGAGRRACPAGPVRRPARPRRARPAQHHIHRRPGTGQGIRHLRGHRRRRRRDRPAARRTAHRAPQLAVDPVRQPDLRRPRDRRRPGAAARRPARPPAQARHPRHAPGLGRPVRTGLRLLQRGQRQLVLPHDLGLPGRRRRAAEPVHLVAGQDPAPAAAAAGADRPQPRRLLHHAGAVRCRHVRRLPLPDLLPPGIAALHPPSRQAWRSCR